MLLSNVLAAICLLTIINVKPIKTSNSTKCHGLCVCLNSTTLDCSNKNLTTVPNDLPSDIKTLLLNNNQIENLPFGTFNLSNLTKVDLTGNKINCGCSLTWTKYDSFKVQLMATCQNPVWVRGRSLANITMEDMCRTCKVNSSNIVTLNVQPQKDDYRENEIIHISCPSNWRVYGSATLMCLANGTWNSTMFPTCQEILPTTPTVITTVQTTKPATAKPLNTTIATTKSTIEHAVTSNEVPTTTLKPQTTRNTTTVKSQTTTVATPKSTRGPTAILTSGQTTTKESVPLSTHQPNVTSAPPQTGEQNVTDRHNLSGLLEMSTKGKLTPKLLRSMIKMLENIAYGRNYSDTETTKVFLNISSNLMKEDNRNAWSDVDKNFFGGEILLNVVNRAIRNQAMMMLKKSKNYSRPVVFKYTNLQAEIHVSTVSEMKVKDIQFPFSKSPDDDYIVFSESSFEKAGDTKVAVIGMKSAELGNLLPRRSTIDGFDNFQTGSGLLSASVLSLQEIKFASSVRINFKNKRFLGLKKENAKCAYWEHGGVQESTAGGMTGSIKSAWSDHGCRVLSRNRSTTICQCDHMTDFVVLTQSIETLPKPTIIMYIAGLSLLIGSLIALIRNVIIWCQTRRERLSVLIHECLAFILTAVVFLLALFLDYHKVMCMIFAALIHWFVLAVFCWILAEFLQLYICIHFGWNRSSSRLKYFAALGWVAPLILVGIILAILRNDYGSKHWCWFSDSEAVLLAYVCPIVLCILKTNSDFYPTKGTTSDKVIVIVILKIACFKSDATDDGEKRDLSVIMVLSTFLIPLVLCTFTMALLSARRPEENVFQYVFAVFCIFLGIYIMVYHCWLDREIMKLSVRKNVQRARPKRDYYSTKETVMYSEGTSEGKSFSLIFPSRKSPTKKPNKSEKKSAKRSDSSSPFDYDSSMPMYPSVNDSSLRSFKSQVSTQQHTLDTPPNTLSAITISRPNSQCIELTSLSDLDRRPDGAEQTDAGEPSEFYGSRHSNPMDRERQRTSGCSNDCTNATTFGKEKVAQKPSDTPNNNSENKNRISGTSSAGLSRTSRSSVSGASVTAAAEENVDDEALENQPFIRRDTGEYGPEIRSDPPAKIPKRRKRGSRRRLDDEFHDDDTAEPKIKSKQGPSTLPSTENSVKLQQYTSF